MPLVTFNLSVALGLLACGVIAGLSYFLLRERRELARLRASLRNAEEVHAGELEEIFALANELRAAKKATEAADAAKSGFLSKMSHEIRTPMNAVIGFTDILLTESMTGRQMGFVRDIRTASSALLGIINDILDMSKIETGSLELRPTNFSLWELLASLESVFAIAAREKGLEILVDESERLPDIVYGDEGRLRQVLVNLLSNAVKFTHAGHVGLSADLLDNRLCFAVSDTGTGMSEDELARIFQGFSQFHHEADAAVGGTGLGVPIVRALVEKMGGSVGIESESGVGTTVSFHIAYEPRREGLTEKLQKEIRRLSCPSARVLLVDDNAINLSVASSYLRLADIEADTAASGEKALAKIRATDYDLVFMDYMMPGMDGIETTRRIRESGFARANLPIVALSANAVIRAREMFIAAGMNDSLAKPIDQHELAGILEKWLPSGKVGRKDPALANAGDTPAAASRFLAKAATVPGLDVAAGLGWTGNIPASYERALRLLGRSLPETIDQLEAGMAVSELDLVTGRAHAIKSALATVGAGGLAREAAALEAAARQGDMEGCGARLPRFVRGLRELDAELTVLFTNDEDDVPRPAGDPQALAVALKKLRAALDLFDGDAALTLLKTQVGFTFGSELDRLLADAQCKAEGFEYGDALAVIDELDILIGSSS